MSIQTRIILKSYFETGDRPTQSQFADFIDSVWHKSDDTLAIDWANMTGKPITFAPSAHTHIWAEITDKPTTFAPSAHTHLWAHITDKPTTFAPSAHTHIWAEITDKPTTFAPSSHNHSASEITSGVFASARLASGTATDGYIIQSVSGTPTWVVAPSSGGGLSGLSANKIPIATSSSTIGNSAYLNQNGGGNISWNNTVSFKGTDGLNVTGIVAASNLGGDGVSMAVSGGFGDFQSWGMPLVINYRGNNVAIGGGVSPTNTLDVFGTFRASGAATFSSLVGTGNRLVIASASGVLGAAATFPIYADNTAALAGGLSAGNLYRTSTGSVQIVF